MKTIKTLLLTITALLCSLAATAHDFETGGIYYNITDATNKTVEVAYQGNYYDSYDDEYTGSVVIPESVTYNGNIYSVTSIGNRAFGYCEGLTSIEIPNSVTSIGDDAFNNCTGLTSIEIPNSVTSIGDWAFFRCLGLTSIEIPNNVTSIGDYAFCNCIGLTSVEFNAENCTTMGSSYYPVFSGALLTVVIGENVKNIPAYAFKGCTGLTSITILSSVTSIGDDAFYNCTGLKTVINFSNLTFSKGSKYYGYVAYYADKVYNAPNGFIDGDFIWYENEDGMTLAGYLGNATELSLPADYNGKSVTSIGNRAFGYCEGLTSIEIPNSVTSIGDYAFKNCI